MRLGIRTLHGAVLGDPTVVETTGDHQCLDALGRADAGNLRRVEVSVAGVAHLVLGRQVEPDLEATHHAFLLLRHLAVDDAARGGHPLHAAVLQQAAVAQEGVEARHALFGEDAGQVDPGAVGRGLAGALFENLAIAHLDLLKVGMNGMLRQLIE
ncbi:hypothetical protein FQZ97_947770 [compost metagenome]